jgi:hypothetical protein
MPAPILTIQYLEASAELASLEARLVAEKLAAAFERLPFSHLLIGWDTPPALLEACRLQAEKLGVLFLRWHPLLTGDGVFEPRSPWQVIGLGGAPVAGFRNMPEFTFVCPNHPEVQEVTQARVESLLAGGLYQGFFLDRIRFPSPASAPASDLGCFCLHCQRQAASLDLDLEEVRRAVAGLTSQPGGPAALVGGLLGAAPPASAFPVGELLARFLAFRAHSVTALVARLADLLRSANLEIGLDCFSPCLTGMVGQDLAALGELADWIKIMSYGHTLGPAGLPYELLGLLDYLVAAGLSDGEALRALAHASTLLLPQTRRELAQDGLSPAALAAEAGRGSQAAHCPVLAGVELVEIPGVTHLSRSQIQADLAALRSAGLAGLAISWDLRLIQLERLDLVRQSYLMTPP